MIEPFRRKSRLLAPTEMPVTPEGICQLWETTSQTANEYRERSKLTVVDAPAGRKTLSKPFRLNGADCAEAGGLR